LIKIESYVKDNQNSVSLFITNAKGIFNASGMVVSTKINNKITQEKFTLDQQREAYETYFQTKDKITWMKGVNKIGENTKVLSF
jgi:hypothetical protein